MIGKSNKESINDNLFIFLIAGNIFCIISVLCIFHEGWTIDNRCESCMMYNPDVEFGLKGIYNHKGYYCVWVGDKTAEEINKTEAHELCHHFVRLDYEHFCGGKDGRVNETSEGSGKV